MQNARTTAVMLEHNQHSGIATTLKLPRAVGGSCGTRSHPRARRWSTELARTMSLENGLSVAAPGASLRAGARSVSVGFQFHWKSFRLAVSQSVSCFTVPPRAHPKVFISSPRTPDRRTH